MEEDGWMHRVLGFALLFFSPLHLSPHSLPFAFRCSDDLFCPTLTEMEKKALSGSKAALPCFFLMFLLLSFWRWKNVFSFFVPLLDSLASYLYDAVTVCAWVCLLFSLSLWQVKIKLYLFAAGVQQEQKSACSLLCLKKKKLYYVKKPRRQMKTHNFYIRK